MDDNQPFVAGETNLNEPVEQFIQESDEQFDHATTTPTENGFLRIAIGVLIGAALGGIAGALTNRNAVDRVNQSIKRVGNSVKEAAANVSETVQELGNAVNSVAVGVNDTVRDVGSSVRGAADQVTDTVETTVSTVQDTTDGVNETVKTTIDAVQNTVTSIQKSGTLRSNQPTQPVERIVAASNGGTLYRLVPVAPDKTDQ